MCNLLNMETKDEIFGRSETNWEQIISIVLSSLVTIIGGWFVYNQSTHDKLTDLRIEQMKSEQIYQMNVDNEISAKINGALWTLLSELGCARVYIVQPHPTHDPKFISATFEVRRPGVSQIKNTFKNINMSDIPVTAQTFAKTDYLYIQNVEESEFLDAFTKAMFSMNGVDELVIIKLVDSRGVWTGNLICDHDSDRNFDMNTIGDIIVKTARSVQYMLPTYNP